MSQKYAVIDADGILQGMYGDDVHSSIPEGAVSITEALWGEWLTKFSTHRLDRKKMVLVELEKPTLTVDELISHAASKRYQVETGGITFNGMKIDTHRESQSMIGTAVRIVGMTGETFQFKAASGFIELSPEQMQNVAVAVASHVQACFTAEADVQAKIKSGEIDSVEKIDAYPWPGSPA